MEPIAESEFLAEDALQCQLPQSRFSIGDDDYNKMVVETANIGSQLLSSRCDGFGTVSVCVRLYEGALHSIALESPHGRALSAGEKCVLTSLESFRFRYYSGWFAFRIYACSAKP